MALLICRLAVYPILIAPINCAMSLQARPPADAFLGYGGIAVRPMVRDGADWFVTSFQDVLDVLEAASR
jgi:phosphoserine phosphatase